VRVIGVLPASFDFATVFTPAPQSNLFVPNCTERAEQEKAPSPRSDGSSLACRSIAAHRLVTIGSADRGLRPQTMPRYGRSTSA